MFASPGRIAASSEFEWIPDALRHLDPSFPGLADAFCVSDLRILLDGGYRRC